MSEPTFHAIEAGFREIASTRDDIVSALVFGSQASQADPADQWSDLDIMAFVENPMVFIDNQEWLHRIGTVRIAFAQPNVFGTGIELRMLLERGLDVEFLFLPHAEIAQLMSRNDIADWVRSGNRIIVDKDGRLTALLRAALHQPVSDETALAESGYRNLVADFFFHVVWTTKKLLRGEILTAKNCCDVYMKELLLRMIVWNVRARETWANPPLHGSRHFEQWADGGIVRDFSSIYAHYDRADILRALTATADLFARVARETAESLPCEYPLHYETHARELMAEYVDLKT